MHETSDAKAAIPIHLFVYGTLMSTADCEMGRPQRERLDRSSRVVGPASVAGALFDLGAYPGLVTPAPVPHGIAANGPGRVFGELRQLHDSREVFVWLDAYEGIDGRCPDRCEYRREIVPVAVVVGRSPENAVTVEAWAYIYQGPLGQARIIADGRWR
jgi:gamma-glutamylcyclotransferase (GGCT)/AIG2-like uncharacterized protein YtfP